MSKQLSNEQHKKEKAENSQQPLYCKGDEKSVEVSSNYLLDMVITLMMVSQTMLMYKFKLVTPENALKQIDMLMDRWVKHS